MSSVNYARHFFYVRLLLILFLAANEVGKNDSRVYQSLTAKFINHAKVKRLFIRYPYLRPNLSNQ